MIVSIDVGGTKTLVTWFDASGKMTPVAKVMTPNDQNAFLNELKTLLAKLDTTDFDRISIGVPGMVDQEGVVLRCGNLPWRDFPLRKLLAETYQCPVFVQNDANLAGLAEANLLPEVPQLCLYVTIGTGIGTGLIVRGGIDPALTHSESGHIVLSTPSGHKIWQQLASGRAITERFGRQASEITDPEAWRKIAYDMALGFQALIPILQPDIIILGGSIGSYFERYETFLHQELALALPEMIAMPPIQQAKHPQEAVVYGAYHYATHATNEKAR